MWLPVMRRSREARVPKTLAFSPQLPARRVYVISVMNSSSLSWSHAPSSRPRSFTGISSVVPRRYRWVTFFCLTRVEFCQNLLSLLIFSLLSRLRAVSAISLWRWQVARSTVKPLCVCGKSTRVGLLQSLEEKVGHASDRAGRKSVIPTRSEEHTSELQSLTNL